MKKHDIEIEISADGEVTVHIKGLKGKGCMQVAEFFKQVVGEVKEQKLTSEYYEKDEARVAEDERVQVRQRNR